MIDVTEAHDVLRKHLMPGPTVRMGVREALFRTLAQPIVSDVDHPPFDRAVMDGYAVRAEDVRAAPVTLKMVGQLAAGVVAERPVARSEAIQINTGAPLPPGADAVVRVEDTEPDASGRTVLIKKAVDRGTFVTPQATYVRSGQTVLPAGARMTPAAIGTAAAAGASMVTVYRRPTVGILSTGDELVDIDQRPEGAQIRNSNQYQLASLIESAHAEPVVLGVARDDRDELRARITQGLRSDVLCITGGISMGAFDFVPEVLKACGATFHIHKMAIKPGRPTIFATVGDGTPVFALPGNPASALVGFVLLVKPALAALEGRAGELPRPVSATLRGSIGATKNRRTYLPARVEVDDDGSFVVEPLSWHGSGDAIGMAATNALIVRAPDSEPAATGDMVRMIQLEVG